MPGTDAPRCAHRPVDQAALDSLAALVRRNGQVTVRFAASAMGRHISAVRFWLQRLHDLGVLQRHTVPGDPAVYWRLAAGAPAVVPRPQALPARPAQAPTLPERRAAAQPVQRPAALRSRRRAEAQAQAAPVRLVPGAGQPAGAVVWPAHVVVQRIPHQSDTRWCLGPDDKVAPVFSAVPLGVDPMTGAGWGR